MKKAINEMDVIDGSQGEKMVGKYFVQLYRY